MTRLKSLLDLQDATGDHTLCDYRRCSIRRARDDRLYLYAAKHLVEATGNDRVRALLKRVDPFGEEVDREWDTFAENERARSARGELEE